MADHMHDTIFVDPFLAEQVHKRRILDADGSPDEPCVERAGARYARPCQHAQQRAQSSRIGRGGFRFLKPVVQSWARDAQNPWEVRLVERLRRLQLLDSLGNDDDALRKPTAPPGGAAGAAGLRWTTRHSNRREETASREASGGPT